MIALLRFLVIKGAYKALFVFLLKGRDNLKYQQKFLKVFDMDNRNICNDLLVVIYYSNHEETFFDQSVSGPYLNFKGKLLKGDSKNTANEFAIIT